MSHSPTSAAGGPSTFDPTLRSERTILGHPVGLFLLFLVEMWERFSYYGMRGLLVLYLISVIAVHQLRPGLYTNELRIEEIVDAAKSGDKATVVGAQSREFEIVVGNAKPGASAAKPPAVQGTPALTLVRAKRAPDPKNPDRQIWVPDPNNDAVGPFALHGEAGNRASFGDGEFGFFLTNPTDKTIKARIGIARPTPATRTYFTVNDNPGEFTVDIKPASSLKPDDEPMQLTVAANLHDSGRNWTKSEASILYGWYTGLAYLFPILGGLIADKLIGTHRSMVVGAILISIGHVILGVSGFGELAQNAMGMSTFMLGLAVIVLGTGHFKPSVSVMVGQLYGPGDPRRDGAFTIFYMGINLGAFICAFVCGTLGEKVGWHWGFGSAAVGMMLGLVLYLIGRPLFLRGIGDAPATAVGSRATSAALLCFVGALALSGLFAVIYHAGAMTQLGHVMDYLQDRPLLAWAVIGAMLAGILAWAGWFIAINRPEDRGPVVTIFVFMLFNAFFWIAFEQAGSSLNVFTEQNTNRMIGSFPVPATWFQSVNAGLIFILAPLFSGLWTALGRRNMNPSQPVKIALGLLFLGVGYIFMVIAGKIVFGSAAKASMMFILMTYFWHTVGELCLSPTGLSYVTKAAPVKFVSLLMGIWFVSSFIANLGGGLVASQVEAIEKGELSSWWFFWKGWFGGQGDFFFLFVVTSIGAGLLILILTPALKRLMRNPND